MLLFLSAVSPGLWLIYKVVISSKSELLNFVGWMKDIRKGEEKKKSATLLSLYAGIQYAGTGPTRPAFFFVHRHLEGG